MAKEVKRSPGRIEGATPARQGETWRQYVRRLRSSPTMGPAEMAGVMAATVLMGKNPDGPANPQTLDALSKRITKQNSFRRLTRDPNALRLARSGKGAELIVHMGEIKRRDDENIRKYKRDKSQVKDDALMLRAAEKSMQDSFAKRSPAQKERESKRFHEMIKRMEHARGLAEKGIPMDGKTARELAQVVQRYNDGNGKTPGGKQQAAASKEALSVMKYLMPQEEFSAYCNSINRAHHAESPTHKRHVDPKAYGKDVLEGKSRSARELMLDSQKQMTRGMTLDGCATMTAIAMLSKSNPSAIINQDDLQKQVKKLKQPGSAFLRTMSDDKARSRYEQLAADGKGAMMTKSIIRDAKTHSVRAAQWQINQAVQGVGKDRGGLSSDKLAAILAARDMAMNSGPDECISNRAFKTRTEQIQKSPGFTALSTQYRQDPSLRNKINDGLSNGDGGKVLEQEYKKANAPQKEKEPEIAIQPKQPKTPEIPVLKKPEL